MAVLKRENNGEGIQGFAPTEIIAVGAESKDTTNWLAFCFPDADVIYQINGAGETATLSAGSIRVVHDSVNSITFSGITSESCEVM
jgi:hypothetical protein